MPNRNTGPAHNRWKGGRTVTPEGYVLIRVGKEHHLADARGYAYEHQLAAEEKLGRRLLPGEEVHHDDENKSNNDPSNLIIAPSRAAHRLHHRTRTDLRVPGEPNALIACACGCGTQIERYDSEGRPRRYVSGHNLRCGAR